MVFLGLFLLPMWYLSMEVIQEIKSAKYRIKHLCNLITTESGPASYQGVSLAVSTFDFLFCVISINRIYFSISWKLP